MVLAWLITIPASALMAALIQQLLSMFINWA
jgi:phosphate/sulfate permease